MWYGVFYFHIVLMIFFQGKTIRCIRNILQGNISDRFDSPNQQKEFSNGEQILKTGWNIYNIHNESVTARNEYTKLFVLKSIEWISNCVKSCLLMFETHDKKMIGLLLYISEICASCGTLSLDSLVCKSYRFI